MLHNFEYSWEERLKKTTFFAVVGTVSSPIQSLFLPHRDEKDKETAILSLLAEQKEEGDANFECSKTLDVL